VLERLVGYFEDRDPTYEVDTADREPLGQGLETEAKIDRNTLKPTE
jgi:hypothetical protein